MASNLRKYSTETFDDLKRRINALTFRVQMALHKYLDKPLLKALQDSLPLAHDTAYSSLKAITVSPSHTTPITLPPTTILHTDFGPTPYRPSSPPRHPPTDIPLPPIPTSTSSFHVEPSLRLPTPPLPEHPGTATCIEAGNMAADTIDALPRGYRRIALLVFDRRHPPNERIAAPPPAEGRGNKSVAMRKQGDSNRLGRLCGRIEEREEKGN